MPKMNGIEPSKINNVEIPASIDVGSWAARPGTGDGSAGFDAPEDGDWYQVTNKASYRYSSMIGEWVRPEVYGGFPQLLARIQGDRLPNAEATAWEHSASGGGTITTDGTKVTFDADGATSQRAGCVYVHGQQHKYHFMQGLVQSIGNQAVGSGGSGGWGRVISIDHRDNRLATGQHKTYKLNLNNNSTTASLSKTTEFSANYNNAPYLHAGTQLQNRNGLADATTSEVFIEFFVGVSGSWAYIENGMTPMAVIEKRFALNTPSGLGQTYFVGNRLNELGKMTIRESFWGIYTPTANTSSVEYQIYGGT